MTLSVVIITYNEEANLGRTLASVQPLVGGDNGETIVVDSGSTDRTIEVAKSYGARVFVEQWKGFAAQKNSALDKANCEWILSLDADEEVDDELRNSIGHLLFGWSNSVSRENGNAADTSVLSSTVQGFWIPRKNEFLGRWIKHGGYWPDPKLRLFRRGAGRFEDRLVHEDIKLNGLSATIPQGALLHHSYPTVSDYIEHMNRYSSLGAEMAISQGRRGFGFMDVAVRPVATFIYNYFFRLGFLDGREGLLLHISHAIYVCWKYAKAWEMSQTKDMPPAI